VAEAPKTVAGKTIQAKTKIIFLNITIFLN